MKVFVKTFAKKKNLSQKRKLFAKTIPGTNIFRENFCENKIFHENFCKNFCESKNFARNKISRKAIEFWLIFAFRKNLKREFRFNPCIK
jgi:hypothetical protein